MPPRKVIHLGHPTLRKKSKEIKRPDNQIARLATELLETMHVEGGIGLAAPQVDVPLSLIVLDLSTDKATLDPMILVNPRIVEASYDDWEFEEGCLSVPGLRHIIRRPSLVTVEASGLDGKPLIIEKADGILGRVLLHEIDHLKGKLFVDYLSEEDLMKMRAAIKKIEKESKRAIK